MSTAALALLAPTAKLVLLIVPQLSTVHVTTSVKSGGTYFFINEIQCLFFVFFFKHVVYLIARFTKCEAAYFSPLPACSTFTCLISAFVARCQSIVPTISLSSPRASLNQLVSLSEFFLDKQSINSHQFPGESVSLPDNVDSFSEFRCFRRKQSSVDTISDARRSPAWHHKPSPIWRYAGS